MSYVVENKLDRITYKQWEDQVPTFSFHCGGRIMCGIDIRCFFSNKLFSRNSISIVFCTGCSLSASTRLAHCFGYYWICIPVSIVLSLDSSVHGPWLHSPGKRSMSKKTGGLHKIERSKVLRHMSDMAPTAGETLSVLQRMRQKVRSPLSVDRKLRWREKLYLFFLVLVYTDNLHWNTFHLHGYEFNRGGHKSSNESGQNEGRVDHGIRNGYKELPRISNSSFVHGVHFLISQLLVTISRTSCSHWADDQ